MGVNSTVNQYDSYAACASVAGLIHTKINIPCQDASFCTISHDHAFRIAAIADGVGSATHAQEAATYVVHTICSLLSIRLSSFQPCIDESDHGEDNDYADSIRYLCCKTVEEVRCGLFELAAQHGENPLTYGCTLLLSVLHERGCAILQIGDGKIVAHQEEKWTLLSMPRTCEYVNEVIALCSEQYLDDMTYSWHPTVDTCILGSDGVDFAFGTFVEMTFTPHLAFLDPLRSYCIKNAKLYPTTNAIHPLLSASLVELLSSEKMRSVMGDDMSLAIIGKI
jgi:hypothetical protein